MRRVKEFLAGVMLFAMFALVSWQFVNVLDWEAQKAQAPRIERAVYTVQR